MLMKRVYANIKCGVRQDDLKHLHIFEGPNGSGKSAAIEAINLLTTRAITDIRGRAEAKEAAAIRIVKTIGTSGPITVEAVFDDGQVASVVAGEGRTSALSGMFSAVTDMNALVAAWIDGSADSNMMAFLRFVAEYGEPEWDSRIDDLLKPYSVADNVIANAAEKFALPKLSVLVSIYEMLAASEKSAALAEKEADNVYTVLKSQGLPTDKALAELEKRRAARTKAKNKTAVTYQHIVEAASRMALRFDDYAECTGLWFEEMVERFGAVVVRPAIPDHMVFGKERGYPFVVTVRSDGTPLPAFHGSQGEWARFYCAMVAAHLVTMHACKAGKDAPYMRFIFADRGYDAGFIRRLNAGFKHCEGSIKLQAFMCHAMGDD